MAKDLLLEIGTEEIPARFMPGALEGLKQFASYILCGGGLGGGVGEFGEVTTLGTPRRLVLHVAEIEEKQLDRKPEKPKQIPLRIAFDEQGNCTKAALGFAKSCGVRPEDLREIHDPEGGDYLRYDEIIKGQPVVEILPEILQIIIEGLSFPKNMRWGNLPFCFVRPIHWIVALFGKKVIEFKVPEIPGVEIKNPIKSSNQSRGHRFLAPDPFQVTSANLDSYKAELEKRFVIVDQDKRRQLIEQQIQEIVSKTKPGCQVLGDKELLEEVNYLVEYPVALCGSFDAEFLDLPREVLINVLREHQKYFAVLNPEGKLEPAFVVISNLPEKTEGLIRSGNERVLRARLADAQFFYQEDQKIRLEGRVENLKGMILQKQLGTYYDKVKRLEKLAAYLADSGAEHIGDANKSNAMRAALLCKADLLTEMVGEFPKLQGIMGAKYAFSDGEEVDVINGIAEHYLPYSSYRILEGLPQSPVGIILSIADKIDNIVGCFGVGLVPSGSQDPYALRRQALGIINILLFTEIHLSLGLLIEKTLKLLEPHITATPEQVKQKVAEFFRQRLHHRLISDGYRYDLVEAALGAGYDDPVQIEERCKALQELQKKKDWEPLVIAFKRVARIIPPKRKFGTPDTRLFQEEAEKQLHRQFCQRQELVKKHLTDENYLAALKELAALRPAVDKFFDDVMVMCEDAQLQNNRLALLNSIADFFNQLADFSKIVTQAS